MGDAPSIIVDQLLNKEKRHYAGSSKHGDDRKGHGPGPRGSPMELSAEEAQKALMAAVYDEEAFIRLKANRGPEKAPKLWWFNQHTGTLYCFHHHGGFDWHGYPETEGRPSHAILKKWKADQTITKKQYNEILGRAAK